MRHGTEASIKLTLVLVCCSLLGCASGGPRRIRAVDQQPPRRLPPAVTQAPAPGPVVPAATTPDPTTTRPVVPAVGAPAAAPGDPLAALRNLYQAAAQRYAATDSYIARLHRREQINGKDEPAELILFKFRKQPWSVHMKWIGDEARGREAIHVKGQHGGKLHTRLAAGDVPFMPAGKRMSFDPDSPLVRSSSRHPITQAGVGNLIERFGLLITALERGDTSRGTLTYRGQVQRPEFPQPCEAAEQTVPPGRDPNLPQGGRRWWFFDPVTQLPALMITQDHTGRQVEYYCYDQFKLSVRLDDDDFNPDKLWGK